MPDTQTRYKEIQNLVQSLNHHLITLTTSLEGRLSSAEEDILANLFRVQMGLKAWLDEALLHPDQVSSTLSHREVDSIAHAQAIKYARDLVEAMRQKKEHQRHLELTSQQLIRAEKLATIGQIAATVAHELGNIFSPLLMYAKLIQTETMHDKSEVAEFAANITEIAKRASDMMRQLVDASRSEPAMMMSVNLATIIENALALLSPHINRQLINVTKRYPDNLPLVIGNPSQLEQVFINMALNAFDAMPDGGNFTIRLKSNGNQASSATEPNFVTIYLSDTGQGIPAEHLGTLFEPFFTTKARGAGSGLGLFVSHLIINQHKGVIEVESELNKGTTFIIKLPVVEGAEK